jgi:outer membrane protein, heavy metal efflux system
MIRYALIVMTLLAPFPAFGQVDSVVLGDSSVLNLSYLLAEAMLRNPEIQEALSEWDAVEARVPQAGSLPDPELKFMQEEMPGFVFNEAMYTHLELMQTIPFPSKLSARSEIATKLAEHAHHDHLEKVNEIIAKLKKTYYELWFIQQSVVLDRERGRLTGQMKSIAQVRYGVGEVSQQDVLKAQVEQTMISNELITLRQQELSAKSMLMSILNRTDSDTLGFAVIPDEFSFEANLDSLITLAMQTRPMILHESLKVDEQKVRLSLARKEYLPDFTFALDRVTSPSSGFKGWSVSAGITLPFAPWTLPRVSAGVEEAAAMVDGSKASYQGTRLMVTNNIRNLYYKADSFKRQLDLYRQGVLPQSRQSLNLSLSSYQTGKTDFLMLIDAYRSYVQYTKEYFMARMNFEQALADLQFEVGSESLPGSR